MQEKTVNLRTQIIDAIAKDLPKPQAEQIFDEFIWPILSRAMENGELMVSRNTQKVIPVHAAATHFIAGMAVLAMRVKADENTISKRKLLNIIASLGESSERAVADIERSGKVDGEAIREATPAVVNRR